MPTAWGATTTWPGPGAPGSGRSSSAISPTRSVTAARISPRPPRPAAASDPSLASAPHLCRSLHDQLQLGHLLLVAERVSLHRRGEPALRRQAQLLDRDVARGLLDPPLEQILALQLAALGGHQTQHDQLVGRDVAQRLKAAGTRVVVLQEEPVHVELAEQRLGDEVIAALGGPG